MISRVVLNEARGRMDLSVEQVGVNDDLCQEIDEEREIPSTLKYVKDGKTNTTLATPAFVRNDDSAAHDDHSEKQRMTIWLYSVSLLEIIKWESDMEDVNPWTDDMK